MIALGFSNFSYVYANNLDGVLSLVRLRNQIEEAKQANSNDGVALTALNELLGIVEGVGKSVKTSEKLLDQIKINELAFNNVLGKIDDFNVKGVSPLSKHYKTAQTNMFSISENINKLKNVKALGKLVEKIGTYGGGAITAVSYKNDLQKYKEEVEAGQADIVSHMTIIKDGFRAVTETYVPGSSKLFTILDDVFIGMVVVPSSDWVGDYISDKKTLASGLVSDLLTKSNKELRTKIANLVKSGDYYQNDIENIVREVNGNLFNSLLAIENEVQSNLTPLEVRETYIKIRDRALQEMLNPSQRREEAALKLAIQYEEIKNEVYKIPGILTSGQNSSTTQLNEIQNDTIVVSSSPSQSRDTSNTPSDNSETINDDSNTEVGQSEPQIAEVEQKRLEEAERQRNKELIEQRIRQTNEEREQREAEINATRSEQTSLASQRTGLQIQLRNKQNELARLEFDEIERVQNELRSIGAELNDLRIRKNASIAPNSALRRQQDEYSQDILYLRGAINIRNNITDPSSVTSKQKNALNALASRLRVSGNSRQEPWQVVLLQANFLLNDRQNKLADVNRRISEVEALGQFTAADDRRLQELVRKEAELQQNQGTIASRISQTKREITNLESDISNINAQFATNNQRLLALDAELESFDFEIVSLSTQLVNWETDASSVQDDLSEDEILEFSEASQATIAAETEMTAFDNSAQNEQSNSSSDTDRPNSNGETTAEVSSSSENTETAEVPVLDVEASAHGYVTGGDLVAINNRQYFVVETRDRSVTRNSDGEVDSLSYSIGSGNQQQVSTDNVVASNFNYLLWGQTSDIPLSFSPATQITHRLQNSFWLYGQETPSNQLDRRTGTASFIGDIYGHFFGTDGGTAGNFYNSVTGELGFTADFSDNSVMGSGIFRIDLPSNDFEETFSINGSLSSDNTSVARTVSSTSGNSSFSVTSSTNIVSRLSGDNGEGYFLGSFFGPEAQEVGGAFGYFSNQGDGAITGIVTAEGTTAELPSFNQQQSNGSNNSVEATGSVTGLDVSDLSTFSVTTGGDSDEFPSNVGDVVALRVTDPSSSNGTRAGIVQASVQGKYDYTAWGEWNGSINVHNNGTDQNTEFRRGLFVVGEPTPSSFISQQTGTATYSGSVIGDYGSQSTGVIPNSVTGTVALGVDFDQRRLRGNLNLSGPNSFSANADITAGFENVGNNGVGYGGVLNANNGSGHINGTFFGPTASETGGSFSFFNNSGENATGIFHAQQSGRDTTPAADRPRIPVVDQNNVPALETLQGNERVVAQ